MRNQYFNPARPVYCKLENIRVAGKDYKRGDRINWEPFGVSVAKMQILFHQGMVHHNAELEEKSVEKVRIGDGLEQLTIEQLHLLVADINGKVKKHTKDAAEFFSKKCKESKIKDKQIGLIRSWRLSYGEIESKD